MTAQSPMTQNKTLGQLILDNQIKDGMTFDERKLYSRAVERLSTVRTDFEWGFLMDCEKDKIKPTIYRYKKYLKAEEARILDYRKNFKKYREEASNDTTK